MDRKTLKALKGSIQKWKKVANGTGYDDGADNCPLCKLYAMGGCVDCPVDDFTKDACNPTPFVGWAKHQIRAHKMVFSFRRKAVKDCKTCKNWALKEVKFLEGLLYYLRKNGGK